MATRRKRIDRGELRVRIVAKSKDRKLGLIPGTYTSGLTCPTSCALRDAGCYAEFGHLGSHWGSTSKDGVTWERFLAWVRALPAGALWRHNIAGDLPGVGDTLDRKLVALLVMANRGRRGFTYTHKPLRTARERAAVGAANRLGFTINLSADSLAQADELAELGVGPVVVTLPSDGKNCRTPAGRHVIVCPAEDKGLTCKDCELCAVPTRKAIVGFRAHGQWHRRIDGRLGLEVIQ